MGQALIYGTDSRAGVWFARENNCESGMVQRSGFPVQRLAVSGLILQTVNP